MFIDQYIGHCTVRPYTVLSPYAVSSVVLFYQYYVLCCIHACISPFTPESDQCQNSPAASPEILHHTVRRTWLFIAYSDEKWLYYKFLLHHSYNLFLKGWENTLFELRSERVNMVQIMLLCHSGEVLYNTVDDVRLLFYISMWRSIIWSGGRRTARWKLCWRLSRRWMVQAQPRYHACTVPVISWSLWRKASWILNTK